MIELAYLDSKGHGDRRSAQTINNVMGACRRHARISGHHPFTNRQDAYNEIRKVQGCERVRPGDRFVGHSIEYTQPHQGTRSVVAR